MYLLYIISAFVFQTSGVGPSSEFDLYAYAKIRGKIVKALIDSGASFNCISVKLANDLGIKKLRPIKNIPKIVLPDGSKNVAVGSVSMGVRFTRHLEEVKFLVINNLSQDCILGQDGQTQFKVRLDWEQHLIRFQGEPVPMERS